MVIDAHQHFWNLQKVAYPWLGPRYGPIYRNFEPSDLEPHLRDSGVDKTILVQAMNSDEDTAYMLDMADRYSWIGAVVGWIPLDNPDLAGARLEELMKHPRFKGVRHLIHEEPDPDWIIRDEVIAGLSVLASCGLPFDMVAVFPHHLGHIPKLLDRIPDLKIVIDHLAKPPIRSGDIELWKGLMAVAASYPQVYAKISGLNTAADPVTWSAQDLRPYVDAAMDIFGPQRLMYGSDWPVLNLAGTYERVWAEMNHIFSYYGEGARSAILGKTAEQFYGV